MTKWEFLGRAFCAILTALALGGLTYLALNHFFPAPETVTSSISNLAFFGTGLSGLIGLWTGWRYAIDVADGIVGEIMVRLFGGAIALVFKAF